jgi:hypothetical protein
MAFNPISSGIGTAIRAAQNLGTVNHRTAPMSSGTANSTPISGTFCSGENTSAPAAPSPIASPTQAPVPAANTTRCHADSGRAPAIATRLTVTAIMPTVAPMRFSMPASIKRRCAVSVRWRDVTPSGSGAKPATRAV